RRPRRRSGDRAIPARVPRRRRSSMRLGEEALWSITLSSDQASGGPAAGGELGEAYGRSVARGRLGERRRGLGPWQRERAPWVDAVASAARLRVERDD